APESRPGVSTGGSLPPAPAIPAKETSDASVSHDRTPHLGISVGVFCCLYWPPQDSDIGAVTVSPLPTLTKCPIRRTPAGRAACPWPGRPVGPQLSDVVE